MSVEYSPVSQIVNKLEVQESLVLGLERQHESIENKEDLFQLIQEIGIVGNKVEEAADVVADLEDRINLITHKLKFITEAQKPSVLVLSNVNPPVFENSDYLTEVIKIAGATVYDAQISDGEKKFNPDILLIISDQMESLFGDVGLLLSLDEWKSTNAVKNNRIYLIEGKGNFKGFGTTIAEEIETLAEIIYPQYLTFGGNGESWVQFEV